VRRAGVVKTLLSSDPRHFGSIRPVLKCPDSSAAVPKCLVDTPALVPNSLDLQQTFYDTVGCTEERFNITCYYY